MGLVGISVRSVTCHGYLNHKVQRTTSKGNKKRKREDNLRTWKWNEVIDVDALPYKVKPSNVPKTEETTVKPHVVASENINVIDLTLQESEIDEEDIPMEPFKRKKRDQIKITGRTRLYRVFDEDSSDGEEDLDEYSSDQEEDLDEDVSDQEEDLDEDESDQEEDLDEDESDQDDSDDGWV
ncbi:hypothetical protein Tco_1500635 [Tanacetum coccineum]